MTEGGTVDMSAPRREGNVGLAPGDTVGRYEIVRRLGAGGMGVVFAARDLELGRMVALKLVTQVGCKDADARLAREARALAKLTHPNVVAVYDVGTHDDVRFIAMELVDGVTLGAWLRAEKPSLREIVRAFIDAGAGLAAIHKAGLVHRDFKPENVLRDADGRARVSDLGLARMSGTSDAPPAAGAEPLPLITDHDAVVGTPAYMAPEQHFGRAVDGRTDQFAFCVTLYEALCGERPFGRSRPEGVSVCAALVAEVTRGAPAPSRGPAWLRKILLRGLEVDPARRFPSMEVVVHALGHGLGRRRRWLLVAGAISAAALIPVTILARRPAPAPAPAPAWQPLLLARDPIAHRTVETVSGDGTTLFSASPTELTFWPRLGGPRHSLALPEGTEKNWALEAGTQPDHAFIGITRAHGRNEVWRYDLATGSGTAWITDDAAERFELGASLVVAPDGRSVLIEQKGADGARPWRLWRLDGPGRRRPIGDRMELPISNPAWSPDGTRLAWLQRQPSQEPFVTVVDASSGAPLQRITQPCRGGLTWSNAHTLLCALAGQRLWRVVEISLDEPGRPRDLYAAADFTAVVALRAVKGGVFLTTSNRALRLALVETGTEKVTPTASTALSDGSAAGWTRDGSLIFSGTKDAQFVTLRQSPDGRVESIPPAVDPEAPLVVLGDDIVYRPLLGAGLDTPLFRRRLGAAPVAVGSSHGLIDLLCAGDRAPPCYLEEHDGDAARAVEWDPATGARGRVVARWALNHRRASTAALSADGRTFAVPREDGRIELIPVAGGATSVVGCRECGPAQHVAWDAQGNILSTESGDPYRLVRIAPGGTMEVLARSDSTWYAYPRVSPDGKTIAVLTCELVESQWWVPTEAR